MSRFSIVQQWMISMVGGRPRAPIGLVSLRTECSGAPVGVETSPFLFVCVCVPKQFRRKRFPCQQILSVKILSRPCLSFFLFFLFFCMCFWFEFRLIQCYLSSPSECLIYWSTSSADSSSRLGGKLGALHGEAWIGGEKMLWNLLTGGKFNVKLHINICRGSTLSSSMSIYPLALISSSTLNPGGQSLLSVLTVKPPMNAWFTLWASRTHDMALVANFWASFRWMVGILAVVMECDVWEREKFGRVRTVIRAIYHKE